MTLFMIFLLLVMTPSYIRGTGEGQGESTFFTKEVQDFWLVKLTLNLMGYASIFVPAALLVRWIRRSRYLDKAGSGRLQWAVRLCVEGSKQQEADVEEGGLSPTRSPPSPSTSTADTNQMQQFGTLLVCFSGLQVSYLTWGVIQEKIMTRDYISENGQTERFKDSQFLVFMNRISAFLLAGIYLLLVRQPRLHSAPLYKYSFASFSNVMSSWCQYEALKYVSFPTQVLAKACKIIPVMLMGKVVSQKTYQYYEYLTAVMISAGMTFFLLSRSDESQRATVTTISGIIILSGYMVFDSFTANWQSQLFQQHSMSSVQMMCGVNFFSCIFTSVSLLEQGSFTYCIVFALSHFAFFWDILLLSLCSAMGQLFIFYTISKFGAVTFVIIMTIRQGIAILLSCILYGHVVSLTGILGIFIVFLAISLRIYCSSLKKPAAKPRVPNNSSVSKV